MIERTHDSILSFVRSSVYWFGVLCGGVNVKQHISSVALFFFAFLSCQTIQIQNHISFIFSLHPIQSNESLQFNQKMTTQLIQKMLILFRSVFCSCFFHLLPKHFIDL